MKQPKPSALIPLLSLALSALAGPALGEEVVVRNDSVEPGSTVAIQAGFGAGESAAAWLTSPCAGNIVAVQVFWLSTTGNAPPSFEDSITIFEAGSFPNPGAALAVLEAPVMYDGFLNEFRYLDENQTIPISIPIVAGETFVVSFKFPNSPPPMTGPSVVTDIDGCQSGENAIYAIPPGAWFNGCDLGISGDFVIRAVVDCAETQGACCFSDGSCDEMTASDCLASGGVYQGDGTDCSTVNCPQPSQACCFEATGGCLDLTEDDCLLAGGIPGGPGTQCATHVCFPIGACCLPDGSCLDELSPEECAALDGVFQGDGTICASVECPEAVGACCFESTGGCLVLTEGDCGIAGGEWVGPGTDCSDNNGNGTADACEQQTTCPGDTDYDGDVDLTDLANLLANYGMTSGATWEDGDFDGDGDVDLFDLAALLANYGQQCP